MALGLVFEASRVLFRFGLDLQSTRDTGFLAALTFGIHIHHGYIGLVIGLVVLAARWSGPWSKAALILGAR